MPLSSSRRNVHPFPARMAPDVALKKIHDFAKPGARVLDPMCGSGTVIRLAAAADCTAIGADLDPLAVHLTRTAAIGEWSVDLLQRAREVVTAAKRLGPKRPAWIERDAETRDFVDYWFAQAQADDLSRLSRTLMDRPRRDDPLRVALSRVIITKDGGASLARDTAHSRPHRTREDNAFDVFDGFLAAADRIESATARQSSDVRPQVRRADARSLSFVPSGSIDLVVTSPPYLNALDYLRGHRLTLVWLGWTVERIRALRAAAVGAERGLSNPSKHVLALLDEGSDRVSELSPRHRGMVYRFTHDASALWRALARVVKRDGRVVMVLADSQLGGVAISNSGICTSAAALHGFTLTSSEVRSIPARHRYLPPPGSATSSLAKRMKEEMVLTFAPG